MWEGSQPHKRTKGHNEGDMSLVYDKEAWETFKKIFFNRQFIIERNVDVDVL